MNLFFVVEHTGSYFVTNCILPGAVDGMMG